MLQLRVGRCVCVCVCARACVSPSPNSKPLISTSPEDTCQHIAPNTQHIRSMRLAVLQSITTCRTIHVRINVHMHAYVDEPTALGSSRDVGTKETLTGRIRRACGSGTHAVWVK
ncbi:hypothetical protein CORC01_01371 [Colletotrichum orchidophilum]|uniref:Uncharacterized protein n=1 Tax=Colletotrichum orchidophilum TaxID=1209926 RepID=A0A1G4BPV1_9PEZI|nr:uncharacterized protein CORC01_01371 [Colletotrichum orchidophilum]OHF03318.1 hypothetical protein CORC01_01371 [Colletotrichum orchidophilum]